MYAALDFVAPYDDGMATHVRAGRTVLLLVVAVLVAAGVAWLALGGRRAAVADHPPAALETHATPPPLASTPVEVVDERERMPASAVPAETAPDADPARSEAPQAAPASRVSVRAHGIVLDLDAHAIANVGVRHESATDVLAWSGADGSFELVLDRHGSMLVAAGDEFATVRGSLSKPGDSGALHLLVVAPAVDLAGVVVDDGGLPLAGVALRIDVPRGTFAGFPRALDATEEIPRETRTDAQGMFELRGVPGSAKVSLVASSPGFTASTTAVPAIDTKDLRIVLRRPDDENRIVSGIVLDEALQPAANATVRLYTHTTKTDASGRFRLVTKDWIPEDAPLVAGKPGIQPAIVTGFGALVAPGAPPVPEQRLVLGGPSLAIRGRVVDAEDRALSNWQVVVLDGVNLTPGMLPSTRAESLADEEQGGGATSRHDGSFVIRGLARRAYVLRCFDLKSLVSFESEPIEAGRHDVVLRVPADAVWKKLDGRVVSQDGTGIANARVTLKMITERGQGGWTSVDGAPLTTDEQGRFTLKNVPRVWTYLSIDGDAVLPASWSFDGADPATELAITVHRRCHFRFESTASGTDVPDALELLDADGNGETIWLINANGWTSMTRMPLEGGKSLVVSAGDGVKTLVLLRDESPIARMPVTLAPGDVQTVRR